MTNLFGFMSDFSINKYLNENYYTRYEERAYALIYDKEEDTLRIVTRCYDNTIELYGENISGFEAFHGPYLMFHENGSQDTVDIQGFTVYVRDLRPLKILVSNQIYVASNFLAALKAMKDYITGVRLDNRNKSKSDDILAKIEGQRSVFWKHNENPYYFFKKPDYMFLDKSLSTIKLRYGADGIINLVYANDPTETEMKNETDIEKDFAMFAEKFAELRN